MTEANISDRPSRSYPAPWRSSPENPDMQTLFLEQNREEELFQRIMGEAKHEKTPLDNLIKNTVRLAFPHTKDNDIERTLGVIKACTAHWESRFDRDGNPCWITLNQLVCDKAADKVQPDAKLPSDAESAAPSKKNQVTPTSIAADRDRLPPLQPKPLRRVIRLALYSGFCVLIYHILIVRGCAMP